MEDNPKPTSEEVKLSADSVSTDTKPQSRALLIKNFVRPFPLSEVKDLLNKTGKVLQWGMDSTRSKCWVIVGLRIE
jgi:hypothetical protein